MDKDQSKRRNLLLVDPTFHDPDYYEFESKQKMKRKCLPMCILKVGY